MFILVGNALLYGTSFFYFFLKNKKRMSLYNLIFLLHFVIAFMGCIIYGNGIYENTFGTKSVDSLSFIPYLLCFSCIWMISYPLKKLSQKEIVFQQFEKTKYISIVINVILLVQILDVALFLVSMGGMMSYDYAEIYEMEHAGESLAKLNSPILNFIKGKTILFSRIMGPVCHILCFYMLVQSRKPAYLIKTLLLTFLACLPHMLTGSRGGVFFLIVDYLFFLFFFWKKIDFKIRRLLLGFSLLGMLFFGSAMLAISESRFENDASDEICRYFGEAYPNLGFNIWDHKINHPYGARYFPSLIQVGAQKSYSKNKNDMVVFLGKYVGVPMLNFKTYFGDLYIEFGVAGAIFISFGICFFMGKFVTRKRLDVLGIVVSYYCFQCCTHGLFGFYLKERFWLDFIIVVPVIIFLEKKWLKNIAVEMRG